MVLNGASLELLETMKLDGFNRLSPAGDGRHVIISTGSAFKVLDSGSWSEAHGDHAHHYATTPSLTARELSNPLTQPSLPTDNLKPTATPLPKLTTVSPSN